MNYDTVLPPRVRAELFNRPRRRMKLWHKILIGLVLLVGLRHLNTVPHRTASVGMVYVYTEETLFGSTYVRKTNGVVGMSSKVFEDLLPSTSYN